MSQFVIQLPAAPLLPQEALPDDVQRFAGAQAPPQARMMAAKGMAPLSPWAQIIALHQIIHGPEPELAKAAADTLATLPAQLLEGALAIPLPPVVLDTMARRLMSNGPVMMRLLFNPNLADATVTHIASKGDEQITELIAQNQARLLRAPDIIEALYFNPQTRMSTVDRMMDFAARNGADLHHLPGFKEVLAAVQERSPTDEAAQAGAEAVDALLQQAVAEAAAATEGEAAEREAEASEGEGEEEEGRSMNLAAQLATMSVPQKVRMALLGGQSARAILVQDTNKVVSRAAIRSPRISEKEVLSFCKMRSLDGELIGYIANHREWTRRYQVKLLLVQHPKTPLAQSMSFLKMLRANDLRQLARSKNIPQAVAQAAKRLTNAKR